MIADVVILHAHSLAAGLSKVIDCDEGGGGTITYFAARRLLFCILHRCRCAREDLNWVANIICFQKIHCLEMCYNTMRTRSTVIYCARKLVWS